MWFKLASRITLVDKCRRLDRLLIFRQFSLQETSPSNLLLIEDIVSPIEEEAFVFLASKVLARKRYEGNHWDDVIIKYKEVDFGSYISKFNSSDIRVTIVQDAIKRIQKIIESKLNRTDMEFQSPHVIDLAPDGWIGPHVDSVKFSGDLIAGLSLGTERSMIIAKDKVDAEPVPIDRIAEYDSMPDKYEFPLKRRSLYIMTGLWRYNYTHEITKASDPTSQSSRRIMNKILRSLYMMFETQSVISATLGLERNNICSSNVWCNGMQNQSLIMEGGRKRQYQDESNLPEGIIVGKKYKLEVGNSSPGLVGLHFSFKPADIDTSVECDLLVNSSKGDASVSLKRQKKSEKDTYKGDAAKDKSYALVFDRSTSSFSLRKVDLMVNQLKFKETIADDD